MSRKTSRSADVWTTGCLCLVWATAVVLLLSPAVFAQAPEKKPALTPAQQERLKERAQYEQQAAKLRQAGKLEEALVAAGKMLAIEREVLGNENEDVLGSLEQIGQMHDAREDFTAARKAREEMLAIRMKMHGADDWRVTDARLAMEDVGLLEKLPVEDRKALKEAVRADQQARQLFQANRFGEALKLTEHAQSVREQILGPEHQETARALNNLGVLYRAQGRFPARPSPLFQRAAPKIREKVFGPNHPQTATSVNDLAWLFYLQANYTAAERLYQRALKINQEIFGPDHPDAAAILNSLALVYEKQGNYTAAEPLLQRALKIQEEFYGRDHPNTVISLMSLGGLYKEQGNFTAAEPLFQRALEIWEKVKGPDHSDTAVCLNNLAMLYQAQGNYPAAESLLRRALKIFEKTAGPHNTLTATSLNNLALLFSMQANYAAAEPLYRRALSIHETAFGPNHPNTATSLSNLAALYKTQGHYAAAEPLYQRALSIREKALGPEHSETARGLNHLARLYESQANYAAAEPLYQQALSIREKALGPEHPLTAVSLNDLAGLYVAQANYAAAEPLVQRALSIREKALGPEHPYTATTLNDLALLFYKEGNFAAAEPLVKRALSIREKALGPEHPLTAVSLQTVAGLCKVQGNDTAAEPLYQRALEITEKSLGLDHPDTAASLLNLGSLEWHLARPQAARPLVGRSLAIQIAHLERTAPIQTEQQQFLMAGTAAQYLDRWLTVTSDAGVPAAESWRKILAWKGQITSRRQGLRQALKDNADYAQLRQATRQWSTLTLNPPAPPSNPSQMAAWRDREAQIRDEWQKRIAGLATELERLEKELSRKYAEFRKDQERKQVSPDDLQAALRKQKNPTALVDLLEYTYFGRKDETGERRIAAYVARGDREIIRVELGAAKPIADLVDRWRESFGRSDEGRQAAKELRQRLWDPLAKHLEGCQTVLISPDGQVTRFPWGALPGDKAGTYLLEEREIALIPTPQLLPEILADEPRTPQSEDRVLLVGDVDFNSDPPALDKDQEASASQGELAGLNPAADKLEGTRQEIQQIAELHKKVFGSNVPAAILTGNQATETALNEKAPQASYLHIATHGFFEEVKLGRGIELASNARGGAPSPSLPLSAFGDQAQAEPMVRSGLLLASVNRPRPWSVEDGKWTALEVGALDLSRAGSWSCCPPAKPGVGTAEAGGEGGAGAAAARSTRLAQRTCVTSLWKVDDSATRVLMTEFYRNLWEKKMPKLEALRQAQLKMLRDYDSQAGQLRGTVAKLKRLTTGKTPPAASTKDSRSPPYYWAAFVVSGDWR